MIATKDNSVYISKVIEQEVDDRDWASIVSATVRYRGKLYKTSNTFFKNSELTLNNSNGEVISNGDLISIGFGDNHFSNITASGVTTDSNGIHLPIGGADNHRQHQLHSSWKHRPDTTTGEKFGNTVALSHDGLMMAVGAIDANGGKGVVWVYKRNSIKDSWQYKHGIFNPVPDRYGGFGRAIEFSRETKFNRARHFYYVLISVGNNLYSYEVKSDGTLVLDAMDILTHHAVNTSFAIYDISIADHSHYWVVKEDNAVYEYQGLAVSLKYGENSLRANEILRVRGYIKGYNFKENSVIDTREVTVKSGEKITAVTYLSIVYNSCSANTVKKSVCASSKGVFITEPARNSGCGDFDNVNNASGWVEMVINYHTFTETVSGGYEIDHNRMPNIMFTAGFQSTYSTNPTKMAISKDGLRMVAGFRHDASDLINGSMRIFYRNNTYSRFTLITTIYKDPTSSVVGFCDSVSMDDSGKQILVGRYDHASTLDIGEIEVLHREVIVMNQSNVKSIVSLEDTSDRCLLTLDGQGIVINKISSTTTEYVGAYIKDNLLRAGDNIMLDSNKVKIDSVTTLPDDLNGFVYTIKFKKQTTAPVIVRIQDRGIELSDSEVTYDDGYMVKKFNKKIDKVGRATSFKLITDKDTTIKEGFKYSINKKYL